MIKRLIISMIFSKYQIEILKNALDNHRKLSYRNNKALLQTDLLFSYFYYIHENTKK